MAAGKRDRRKGSGAKVMHVGKVPAMAPPVLRGGQVRCPICRNGVRLTTRGNLYRHADLFGNPCGNRSTLTPVHVVAPPIVLPPERYGDPRKAQPRAEGEPSRLDVGSSCRECGKWLPGERSLCGRCYAVGPP